MKKIEKIINKCKKEIEKVIIDTYFKNTNEIEQINLFKYINLGDDRNYDVITHIGIAHNKLYVYFPNYKEEYSWQEFVGLSIDKIQIIVRELEIEVEKGLTKKL